MKFLHTVFAAMASLASLSTALPSESRKLEARDSSRLVFSHFMMGIVGSRSGPSDWDLDMQRAKSYGIDAFALNIGTDSFSDAQLQYAYTSAANNGMKVFISFDFAWWSTGNAAGVGQKIAQYAGKSAQLMVDGKVFVSSFVGDGVDVNAIRNAAGVPIYFAPNFNPGWGTSMVPVDAAFNWMAWPNNGQNRAPAPGQTGTVEAGDASYISALKGKDYMAPISPWFFTHYGSEVSYSKNFMFPGDLLWYQRWNQLLASSPRFIEIISWNDYGESHYVGPLSSPHSDDGASKWVNDMPHDGWLDMAKPFIAAYKAGSTSVNNYIASDQLIYWYRPQSKNADCSATDTCMAAVNNPDYYIGKPNGWDTVSDSVFVVSLLKTAATLQVGSGSNVQTFNAPAGASSFSIPMGFGKQTFTLTRGSQTVLSGTSRKDILDGCACGLYNFNAYVGTLPEGPNFALGPEAFGAYANGMKVATCKPTPSLGSATPASSTTATTTTTSSAATTTTSSSAATTTTSSAAKTTTTSSAATTTTTTTSASTTAVTTTSSKATTTSTTRGALIIKTSTTSSTTTTPNARVSKPATTLSTTAITTTSSSTAAVSTAAVSIAAAPVCNAGTGSGNYIGLCQFTCQFGYCPPGPCTCTSYGAANPEPPVTGVNGVPAYGLDASYSGLCAYTCYHGYCPSTACRAV